MNNNFLLISITGKGKSDTRAFTLVELIVVIVILAILGTIAFISLQGYSRDTRNSVRLSDLSNINKMLGVKIVESGKVSKPDSSVEISATGVVISYQGVAGEKVLPALRISNGGKDPKDDNYYTYVTNSNLSKYQLMGFLEGDTIAFNNNTLFAADIEEERIIKTYGDELGVLFDSVTNKKLTMSLDILNSSDIFKVVFSENESYVGTGEELFTYFYNRSKELLTDKDIAKLDDSLVLYFDMETSYLKSGSGVLKDFSQYGNGGICVNNGNAENCGSSVDGPTFEDGGKMGFREYNDYIRVLDNPSLNVGKITVISRVKINKEQITDILGKYRNVNNAGYLLRINGGDLVGYLGIGSTSHIYYGGYFDYGKWKNVSMTYDGELMKLFNDGVAFEKHYDSFASITSEGRDLRVPDSWFGHSFDGLIDEIRIYNRALSDFEVKTVYESVR